MQYLRLLSRKLGLFKDLRNQKFLKDKSKSFSIWLLDFYFWFYLDLTTFLKYAYLYSIERVKNNITEIQHKIY